VAGIGDEVGAHLLDPPQRRQIMEGQQHQVGLAQIRRAPHRHHDRLEPAIERPALGILDALLLAAGRRAADRLDQFGHAQRQRNRLALPLHEKLRQRKFF